jgi:uncharacterized protein YjcR
LARAPDERIKQAKALYLKGLKLVEIASQLNLPEGTVRRWKSTHKWDNERSHRNNERSHKKGPPIGNKNAVGNDGGAPERNKNAVKTGEFETLFFDALEEDEKQLIQMVQLDKEQLLLQEIQLLTVRERRMLKRIEELKHDKEGAERLPSIEDALTRVQSNRQKAIDSLHRYGYDDARLELEIMKVELETLKRDSSDQEIEDDGFMDAMNEGAAEIWGDADD